MRNVKRKAVCGSVVGNTGPRYASVCQRSRSCLAFSAFHPTRQQISPTSFVYPETRTMWCFGMEQTPEHAPKVMFPPSMCGSALCIEIGNLANGSSEGWQPPS